MSFLNRFFNEVYDQSPLFPSSKNSFESVSDSQLAAHLEIDTYDSFQLTEAVRPALDLKIKPSQGYRHDVYIDEDSNSKVPVVMAAASKKHLFPLFMQLIQRLGPVVDVVLETSHDERNSGHVDLYRDHIDMPVLTSILWDYEELLTNDGCTGIAVLNPNTPQEVQFDEHKLLIIYGSPLEQFEHILEINNVLEKQDIRFITEAEHIHSSSEAFARAFHALKTDLGLDGTQRQPQDGESYDEGFV
jgi:hypothetical protein